MFVFYGYCLHAQDFMRNIISKFRKYVDQLKEPNKSLDDYLHSSLSQAFNHGHLSPHQDLLPGGDDDELFRVAKRRHVLARRVGVIVVTLRHFFRTQRHLTQVF